MRIFVDSDALLDAYAKLRGKAISNKMKRIFEVRMDQGLKQPAHRVLARLYGDATGGG